MDPPTDQKRRAAANNFGELEGLLKGSDRRRQELFLRIELTQLEVVLRQRRLEAETRVLQITGARLSAGLVGLHTTANSTPDVELPRYVESQGIIGNGSSLRRWTSPDGGRLARAVGADADRRRRKVTGTGLTHQRLSLAVLGLRRGQVLVRDADLSRQCVQLGITEDFPPSAADQVVLWLGDFPAIVLFVSIGRNDRGPHVVRPHYHARAQGRNQKRRHDDADF